MNLFGLSLCTPRLFALDWKTSESATDIFECMSPHLVRFPDDYIVGNTRVSSRSSTWSCCAMQRLSSRQPLWEERNKMNNTTSILTLYSRTTSPLLVRVKRPFWKTICDRNRRRLCHNVGRGLGCNELVKIKSRHEQQCMVEGTMLDLIDRSDYCIGVC